MSGIEVLTNFFENIRPRYSWSSSETVTSNPDDLSISPSGLVGAAHDGDHSDGTLASPPTSPVHHLGLGEDDCGSVCTDVEDEGSSNIQPLGLGEFSLAHLALPFTDNASPQSALDTGNSDSSRLANTISSTPPIAAPSEFPSASSSSSRSSSVVNQITLPVADQAGIESPQASTNIRAPPSLAIPEDDGHQVLREKLLNIQKSGLTERERAQKMHSLMTENYLSRTNDTARPISPSSSRPRSLIEGDPFNLSEEDKEPSYANEDENILGCMHYRRNVKLQCSTCDKWYPCRFCHDDKESHSLIRKDTKNMLCMYCGTAQPAAQTCRQCVRYAAIYYCDKCKLWDDDPSRTIYHCNDCGICRIGRGLGKDFFHCKKCGVCMSIELEGQHRCIERSTDCDCPICGEYLFTSVMTVVFMTCGHSIHLDCYNEHMKSSYRCPTCAKSVFNMESRFRYLDYEIQRQPLPDPYRFWHCHIICNDCSAKSDVPFHFLGLKCDTCKSYNTCEVKLIRPEDEPEGGFGSPLPLRSVLPPRHLMPNPETAGSIIPGADVVTDLASVLREIEGHESRPPMGSHYSIDPSEDSECSCASHRDGAEESIDEGEAGYDSLYDSDGYDSDGLNDYDDDYDDTNDDRLGDSQYDLFDEEPAGPEIIHLPGHP